MCHNVLEKLETSHTNMLTHCGIDALSITYLPYLLVACKCDNHPVHREVDPAIVEQKAQKLVGEINVFQTSESAPETQQRSLAVILRSTIAARRSKLSPISSHPIYPAVTLRVQDLLHVKNIYNF
jgi:hypothetical protein